MHILSQFILKKASKNYKGFFPLYNRKVVSIRNAFTSGEVFWKGSKKFFIITQKSDSAE